MSGGHVVPYASQLENDREGKESPSSYRSSTKRRSGATAQSNDEDDERDVELSPFTLEWTPILIAVLAVFIAFVMLAFSIWLAIDPVTLPSGNYVVGSLSLKTFNVIITVLSSIVAIVLGSAISTGSSCWLVWNLVRPGGGITIEEYERWSAIGNGATVSFTSLNAVLPLILFILSAGSGSAINAVFAAGTANTAASQINLTYASIVESQAVLSTLPGLYNRQDFEGYIYKVHETLILQGEPNSTISEVDGIPSNVGIGVVPAINEVATLTARIMDPNGPGALLPHKTRKVIGAATANTYTFSAPTVQANFTCQTGAMSFQNGSESIGDYVSFSVTDPVCGAISNIFHNLDMASVAAYTCMNATEAYIGYFSLNANTSAFEALASCTGPVLVGTAAGLSYWDSQVGEPSSYSLPAPVSVFNATDYSTVAVNVLTSNWVKPFGAGGSPSLTELLATSGFTGDLDPSAGEPYYSMMEVLSSGLAAMALAKIDEYGLYIIGVFSWYGRHCEGETVVDSPAIIIGPIGLNKLWIILFGGSLISLVQALMVTIRHRPTPFDPLDPVAVMLVAQNSPPTHHVDGGCLGSSDQIRSPKERITYRAVNAVHLAFIWGASLYEGPVVGRMYGKLSGKDE